MFAKVKIKHKFYSRETKRAVQQASLKGRLQCGALVEANAKQLLAVGGRRGKTKSGKVGRVPSDPPAPPHTQSGNLKAAITHAPTPSEHVIVGPTTLAKYGGIHEAGGEFGGRHYPARPYMLPALIMSAPSFARIIARQKLSETAAGRKLLNKGKVR